jgi:hypothetical protein
MMMPICGGTVFDYVASEDDSTSASISKSKVDSFVDSAFVKYDSSEPANGTLLFYNINRSNQVNLAKKIKKIVKKIN